MFNPLENFGVNCNFTALTRVYWLRKMSFVPRQSVCFRQATEKEVYHRKIKGLVMDANPLSTWPMVVKLHSWCLETGIGDGHCILTSHHTTQDFSLLVDKKCMGKIKNKVVYFQRKTQEKGMVKVCMG